MRINTENKSIDIETRDINFIIDSYAVSYKFSTKNLPLERVVIPMFATAHTRYGDIPIEFVPDVSAYAKELVEDGKAVREVTPAEADEIAIKDTEISKLKKELMYATAYGANTETGKAELAGKSVLLCRQLDEDAKTKIAREPRQPSGPIIPPGEGRLELAPRDPADLRKTKADLAPEKEIDESKEKPTIMMRDENGQKRIA